MYRIKKNRRNPFVSLNALETEEGTIIRKEEDIRKEMKKYFAQLYTGKDRIDKGQEDSEIESISRKAGLLFLLPFSDLKE